MNDDWNLFLQQQDIDNATSQADCALCDLSDFGLIRVSGEDAHGFLQGQLSNDINHVCSPFQSDSAGCYG